MARLTQHWHRIEVTGTGRFPIDMLRYDQCHPLYESDVAIILHPSDDSQIVALGRWAHSRWVPTESRWKSFHWTVTHHEVME